MNFGMRPPAIPLINVDPYFSLWSPYNSVTDGPVKHWTGAENNLIGSLLIDGVEYGFLGKGHEKVLMQTGLEITAFTTELTFQNEQILLKVRFTSPLLPNDIELMSEPIGFMECEYSSKDGKEHKVALKLLATEELCLNKKGEDEVLCDSVSIPAVSCFKMGSKSQNILGKCGDNVRIDWGYFYLASNGANAAIKKTFFEDMTAIELSQSVSEGEKALIVFAYDDVESLTYFGKKQKAYWKKDGTKVEELIEKAFCNYQNVLLKCREFSDNLISAATKCGNGRYAEMLSLSFRQIMAAHKLVTDENGELIYISKECFSNGCAGTVDVAYPSSPMFLLYNSDLLEAMLRPVFRYADSNDWKFEFAPHDLGRYPICNGQVYFNNDREHQMPIEECGNMLIMCAALTKTGEHKNFLKKNKTLLRRWADYLIECGLDPENQLCTDDFSGHLAHNCNLSAKAIMGVKGYAMICEALGESEDIAVYDAKAFSMAKEWEKRALSNNGWYKHTFDSEDGYSLKYNLIWDKVWKSGLFSDDVFKSEIQKYKTELAEFGVPLDQRASYTKSDWMLWIASFCDNNEDFCIFSDAVFEAFDKMNSRVPMTDWYDTLSAGQCTWVEDDFEMGFQHRSVQGGLFMRLLT